MTRNGDRKIADYALIGNAHTAALVATDGSIDWCCWPRFDSPAIFCRLLNAGKGGWFRVGPTGQYAAGRSYVGGTSNVLATTFTTASDRLVLTCPSLDLQPDASGGLVGRLQLTAGDRYWITLTYGTDDEPADPAAF